MANHTQMDEEDPHSRELDRMAKISKKVLKSVVKDCLVEILQEGLLSQNIQNVVLSNSDQINKINKRSDSAPVRSSALDSISYGNNSQAHPTITESKIKNAAQSLTSDPIMSSIFEDTARTTLQEQYSAESAGPRVAQGDAAARMMATSDPTDMFAEASNNWAALAFSD